jgi:hypothetical protein
MWLGAFGDGGYQLHWVHDWYWVFVVTLMMDIPADYNRQGRGKRNREEKERTKEKQSRKNKPARNQRRAQRRNRLERIGIRKQPKILCPRIGIGQQPNLIQIRNICTIYKLTARRTSQQPGTHLVHPALTPHEGNTELPVCTSQEGTLVKPKGLLSCNFTELREELHQGFSQVAVCLNRCWYKALPMQGMTTHSVVLHLVSAGGCGTGAGSSCVDITGATRVGDGDIK